MSILFEENNCVFISHSDYITQIYKDLSLTLAKDLFAINVPYKKLKLKGAPQNDKLTALHEEINFVREKYKEFHKKLHLVICASCPESKDNKKALDVSKKLYEESAKTQVTNVHGGNTEKTPVVINLNSCDFIFPGNCKFYSKNVMKIQAELANEKYDVIVIDPPWWNKAVRRKRARSTDGYPLMHNEDLKAIPIESLLKDTGILVVWCTNSPAQFEELTGDIFTKWNVSAAAKWFWVKVTRNAESIVEFSRPPCKQPYEKLIIASRDLAKLDLLAKSDGKLIASVPSALHSHKPPLCEILNEYTSGDCLEIFARYLLPNWTSYGLETLQFQNICLYNKL